jgi:ABC-2 type transport system permease protein
MRSLRSTWILAAATATAVVGLGVLIGVDTAGSATPPPPGATAWEGAHFTAMFALFGVLALAVLASTADHATGGIVPTLQWTPRRGVLLTARSAVIAAVTTLMGVLLVGMAAVVIRSLVPAVGLPLRQGLESLGGLAFLFGTGALLAIGIGLALRSTAGALVTVIALILVLPLVLGNLPQQWAQDIAALLPGSSVIFLISGEGLSPGMTVTSARTTMAVWACAVVVGGGWRLLRTDASR